MSRKPRQNSEYLHVIVRGIGKQILFEDDFDRLKYLDLLKKYREETGISIFAYCLMGNHVHLLLHDITGVTPVFMKKVGVGYAQYYNRRYDRTGHLFQDRYKSETIEDDSYLLAAFRYILNNPYKAGICAAKDYQWSSFKEYGLSGVLTDTGLLVDLIGRKDMLLEFLGQNDGIECMEEHSFRRDDAWAIEKVKSVLSITSGTQLQQYDRTYRDNALALLKSKGLSVRQIERVTGINRGIIQRAR